MKLDLTMFNFKTQIMITLLLFQEQKSVFSILGERIQEGGPKTMTLLLILFILEIVLIIRSFIIFKKGENTRKNVVLINSIGFLTLAIAFFSHTLSLIDIFDENFLFDSADYVKFGSHIKYTLLPILFGIFIFLVSRISTIILTWLTPKKHFENE